MPWLLLICTLLLIGMGLGGIARGDELSASGGDHFSRQCVWAVISLAGMWVTTWIPYRVFRRYAYGLFALSLVLLVVVYFMPARNGSHRWIPIGIGYFQPSELAKLAVILSLANYLMYRSNYRRLTGLLIPFLLTMIPVGLVLREPDLGTSLLFFPVLFAMLFAAGARPRHLGLIVFLGACTLPLLWVGMSAEQKSRVVTLFAQQDGGPTPRGDDYHLHQSKQVLALGGVWGSDIAGMKLDDPLAYHLPAGKTDFIFCLVGERWGFLGCCFALLLYAILFAQGLQIAAATREPFGRLLAVGIVTLLATQTAINTGMTVGLMPITGMTLPLMSYGGSSLLATSMSLGLLTNISMRPGYEVCPEPFRFTKTAAA